MAKKGIRQAEIEQALTEQATKQLGLHQMVTRMATHYCREDGSALCNTTARLDPPESVLNGMPPECGRCRRQVDNLIEQSKRSLLRNVWNQKLDAVVTKPLPRQRKPAAKLPIQLGLDAELLPVGSGRLLREG